MIDPVHGTMFSYQNPAYKKTGDKKRMPFLERSRRRQKSLHQNL